MPKSPVRRRVAVHDNTRLMDDGRCQDNGQQVDVDEPGTGMPKLQAALDTPLGISVVDDNMFSRRRFAADDARQYKREEEGRAISTCVMIVKSPAER